MKIFTTSATSWKEAWVACPTGYTAISAVIDASQPWGAIPGTMTGNDAQQENQGDSPPAGTTFTASVNGGSSPNAYHFSSNGLVSTKLTLICIPN